MERKTYGADLKAQVFAALLSGDSVTSVARRFGIPDGTIKSWQFRQRNEPVAVVATVSERAEIGERLNALLRTILDTFQTQAEQLQDPEWVKKQSAGSMSSLLATLADRGLRICAALEQGTAVEQPKRFEFAAWCDVVARADAKEPAQPAGGSGRG